MAMQIDRKLMKKYAIQSLHTYKPNPLLSSLIYCFVVFLLDLLRTRIINMDIDIYSLIRNIYAQDYSAFFSTLNGFNPSATSIILVLAIEIVTSVIYGGFLYYSINIIRNYRATVGTIFDVFEIIWKIIWLNILKSIFVILWSLLLIVPGIIAIYKYRYAEFIMFDNPDFSAYKCIRESTRITTGYKSQLFILDLSFLGWYLLTSLPIVGYFINIYVLPYVTFTNSYFYEILRKENNMPAFNGEQVYDEDIEF